MVGPQGLFQCLLLSCKDSCQLAELSACLVSCIWKGSTTQPIITPSVKRSNAASINVFKQFCQKIFQDTQISSGCILLALYYLQELRSIYPTLRSTLGSEFRIFTTALILANKYLDDNTFTNRTWSEVSGIPIHELNIMEMEYLTALDYNLHVHCNQFRSWVSRCQQYIHTPPSRPLKRSSTTSHYPSFSHHHHPNKYSESRFKYYFDPIYPHSQASAPYSGGGINKKKRKRVISPPQSGHSSYLPTPPTKPSIANLSSSLSSSFPISIPITPPPPFLSTRAEFKPPLMSWSSSMPIIPNSGATAAVNAAAYVTYHHQHHHQHQHHYHYNTPNALVNRIRCLEIE